MAQDPPPSRSPSEPRLPFETPIYEMEARLSELEAHYAKNRAGGDSAQDRRTDPPAQARAGCAEARNLLSPRALADRPGLAPPAAAANSRLHRADLRAVPRAARRPRLGRRQGDRHRTGPPRRHQGHVHRPSKGQKPRRAQEMQLRLCSPRGLSQGTRQDAARREIRPADHLLHRYAGRLSGDRRRGTWPGRDHRREPDGDEPDPHARSSAS